VHPDRLKRQEGLSPKDLAEIDTVAKEIGEAAVGLSNPKDRAAAQGTRAKRMVSLSTKRQFFVARGSSMRFCCNFKLFMTSPS